MSIGNDIFGARLKVLRIEYGLSQKNLGILAGIDQFVASTRINRYEQAVHSPDYTIVRRLGDVLNAPTAYFYADEDEIAELLLMFHRTSKKGKCDMLKSVVSIFRENENLDDVIQSVNK